MNWAGIAGIAGLITALTATGALFASQQSTQDSLDATRDQIAIAEQGQYTDRYTRAVDQLGQQGPDRLPIRLGGIYALERLARDSPRDQPTVMEVLSAFIRKNAPNSADIEICGYEPPEDIQAAAAVLGRRNIQQDRGVVLNLQKTCLQGAELDDANFTRANFKGSNLNNVEFNRAKLNHAIFDGVYLNGAKLRGADLRNAEHDEHTHTEVVATDDLTKGQWW